MIAYFLIVLLSFSYFLENADSISVPDCDENEEVNPCGADCSRTCEDVKNGRTRTCPTGCIGIPSCKCKKGYARSPSGACISDEECLNM
ncbi:hypothetical protein B4U80_14226 [Leptotrombidium deliense]|uniref:TIL domain-containing protein n=1 Tax=Leptotrombidium deliense TaxID=299467 RepID=A0A443RZR2_9ACAR|nr:hypothetical protein B4U80_14226 [Leptotrombidium deliense]